MQNKNLIFVTTTANIFEWYEFSIMGFLSIVLGELFFNSNSIFMSAIQGSFIFLISYLIRPIGGIYWSKFIQHYGRVKTLKTTIIIMALPTVIIGILPTYKEIGIYSTIFLIIFRIIQGFGAGGELPITAIYIMKQPINLSKKILLCSLLNSSSLTGILLASSSIFLLYHYFSHNEILNWAWRIPFLMSLPIFVIIFLIRTYIPNEKTVVYIKPHINYNIKVNFLTFLKPLILVAFIQVTFYIMYIWLPIGLYMHYDIAIEYGQKINTISLIILVVFTIIFGFFCSKFGYKLFLLTGITCTIISIIGLFTHISINNIYLYIIIFTISYALVQSSFLLALAHMCNGDNLESKIILYFSLGTAVFGSTSPLLCTWVLNKFNFIYFPFIYITILGIISLFIVIINPSEYQYNFNVHS